MNINRKTHVLLLCLNTFGSISSISGVTLLWIKTEAGLAGLESLFGIFIIVTSYMLTGSVALYLTLRVYRRLIQDRPFLIQIFYWSGSVLAMVILAILTWKYSIILGLFFLNLIYGQ